MTIDIHPELSRNRCAADKLTRECASSAVNTAVFPFCMQKLCAEDIPFVAQVYRENCKTLHGGVVSDETWRTALYESQDPTELNLIISAYGERAAWLKLNGLDTQKLYISMLVVSQKYQRMGVGSWAVTEAEKCAIANGKTVIKIHTTADNTAAMQCYLKCGYRIANTLRYMTGDGILRDGYCFEKVLKS